MELHIYASSTQWTWVWANSRRQWRTGKSSVVQSMGPQRTGYHLATEQQQQCSYIVAELDDLRKPLQPETASCPEHQAFAGRVDVPSQLLQNHDQPGERLEVGYTSRQVGLASKRMWKMARWILSLLHSYPPSLSSTSTCQGSRAHSPLQRSLSPRTPLPCLLILLTVSHTVFPTETYHHSLLSLLRATGGRKFKWTLRHLSWS